MKKSIIFLSLISIGLIGQAKAEYSDYYKVYYQGKELKDGDTIICDNAYTTTYKGKTVYIYEADINVVNQLPYTILNRATIDYIGTPSLEEYESNPKEWGKARLCYRGGDANGEMASCMGVSGIVKIPDSSMDCFNWEFHLENVPLDLVSEYGVSIKAAEGELQWNNYQYIENTEFSIKVIFTHSNDAGIKEINDRDILPTYYSLDGKVVNNPTQGLFLEKKGNLVKKVYIGK